MKRLALAAALLLCAAALAGVGRPEGAHAVDATPGGDSVTVTGSGSVSSVPNVALLSLGVDSRAASAAAAAAANATAMRRVIDAVRAAGGRNVTTASVSLSPVLGQDGAVTGFAASNAVTTTIDVGRAGAVIDAGVRAGANQVSGPSLSSSDQTKQYVQALKAAVADAREKAGALAAASGRSLGKVTTVAENSGFTPVPMFSKAAASDSGTPIEPGLQQTTASVTVTFGLA